MHFIAHQLRTWNKEAYLKALALEMALGMLCRKTEKAIHLGQSLPHTSGISRLQHKEATQHRTNPGRA